MENRDAVLVNTLLTTGLALIVSIAATILTAAVGFFIGITISPYHLIIPATITLGCTWLACRTYFGDKAVKFFAGIIVFVAALSLSAAYVSYKVYDFSYDGQTYHQEAIIQLKNGWNPVYDKPIAAMPEQYQTADRWLNTYAKGPWIGAAALYAVTDRLEVGKAFNYTLIVASLLLAMAAFLSFRPGSKVEAGLIGLLVALNPVSSVQAPTFTVDGQVASCIAITFALGFLLWRDAHIDRYKKLGLIAVVLILCNIKFTALVYTVILLAGYAALLLVFKKQSTFRSLLVPTIVGLAAAVLVIGFNPYLTNTFRHGHPFYPLAGKNKIDIITQTSPATFPGHNRFENFAVSLFSRTDNPAPGVLPQLKWPWQIQAEEYKIFSVPDVRLGAYGPFFALVLVASLVILMCMIAIPKERKLVFGALAVIALVTVITFINPGAWWARYTPQVWLVPIIILALACASRFSAIRVSALILASVLLFNAGAVYVYNHDQLTIYVEDVVARLATIRAQNKSIDVALLQYYPNRIRLTEHGVDFKLVDELSCKKAQRLFPNSEAYYCIE